MAMKQTVLVLGLGGGVGGETARQLHAAGWQVRAMQREIAPAQANDGIVRVRGDAMNPAEVLAAAEGCAVIVHAVNPPGYRRWSERVLPMLDSTIAAARQVHASIVLPGTVYNYGPDAFPFVAEGAAQRPLTRKGGIRVEMERRLQAFSRQDGRVVIVRAGDFFGPQAANNWFAQGLIKPDRAVRTIYNPGRAGVGHQWSYLPDVARTVVELLKRADSLDAFATFHMQGHWDASGTQMVEAIRRVVGKLGGGVPRVAPFPWWLLRFVAPFNETVREMMEMRYLWQEPVRLDNARLVATLGTEPFTPLDLAVEQTLRGLHCLPTG
ncbi:NAD-dependent epimerase/dehydratase family protein [Paludibacterium yongneupense]|uniref:NAD-dependent epimerase/dehydratase family protein n=1 Tax=Paludibacterium yongneupense TaxID=400061 RepID=UPI0004024BDB|nr:NAD-dependent epimerase/dehydratase family protein [Paludibacterium yongneupense]